MNILFLTNTYLPLVGGVARSVSCLEAEFLRRGHQLLIVAPQTDPPGEDPPYVVRVPALTHVTENNFSAPILPGLITAQVRKLRPQVVHSHHPFLLGNTAMRIARARQLPLVFTYHTMYEQYAQFYSWLDPELSRQFMASLAAGYANLCDAVIAPSQSVAEVLRDRGVSTTIEVIPTGVEVDRFARGDGATLRQALGIPLSAFVVGHVGRLAPEKNLGFLAEAVAAFMAERDDAHFLVVGFGPSEPDIRQVIGERGLAPRLHMAGTLEGQKLIDAYHAMDVFAFSSQTDTQGMVLAEAMAAELPVVALDGPGVRDVVRSGRNGRIVKQQDARAFAGALAEVADQSAEERTAMKKAALATANQLSLPRTAGQILALYERLIDRFRRNRVKQTTWARAKRRLQAEWELLTTYATAAGEALEGGGASPAGTPVSAAIPPPKPR
jgi:glycosyltransferase involved in cell wall biosynthesis